jgi:cyclase
VIAAVDRVLSMTGRDTKVIPGHGPLSTRSELERYRRMLVSVRDRVRNLVRQGKTLADVQTARPTAEFDATWGKGFLQPQQFVEILYSDLSKR